MATDKPKRLTNGACRERLELHGYALACSLASLAAKWDQPAILTCRAWDTDYSDARGRQLAAIVVSGELEADRAAYTAVMSVLKRYKLTAGPCRVDDDGTREFLFQYDGLASLGMGERGMRRQYSADRRMVTLWHCEETLPRQEFRNVRSHMIALPGTWENGDPLTVPRRDLPVVDLDKFDTACAAAELDRWNSHATVTAVSEAAA